MTDNDIIAKVQRDLTTCVPGFRDVNIIDSSVVRLPKAVTHFSPGSYPSMLPGVTPLANVFMSGDWIVTRHGSWSQEKAYVTGLEAANRVIDQCRQGSPAAILPIEPDEPHIQVARQFNRQVREFASQVLPPLWLP